MSVPSRFHFHFHFSIVAHTLINIRCDHLKVTSGSRPDWLKFVLYGVFSSLEAAAGSKLHPKIEGPGEQTKAP